MVHGPNTALCLFGIKLYWNIAMFIHVNALCDYFHVAIVELGIVRETIWPTKLKIYILGLYSTSVLSPVLCQWFPYFSAHWNHLENLKPCC